MGLRRRGDHKACNVVPGEHVVQGKTGIDLRILLLEAFKNGFVLVADELQHAQVVIVPHKVFAPVTGADDGDHFFPPWMKSAEADWMGTAPPLGFQVLCGSKGLICSTNSVVETVQVVQIVQLNTLRCHCREFNRINSRR